MTPKQFDSALDKTGFTRKLHNGVWTKGQQEFARCVCVNDRTVGRWSSGESEVPVVVALLLNVMLDHKLTREDLRS